MFITCTVFTEQPIRVKEEFSLKNKIKVKYYMMLYLSKRLVVFI